MLLWLWYSRSSLHAICTPRWQAIFSASRAVMRAPSNIPPATGTFVLRRLIFPSFPWKITIQYGDVFS